MPYTTIHNPQGEERVVKHPEGATKEQIVAYGKANWDKLKPPVKEPTRVDRALDIGGDLLSDTMSLVGPIKTAAGAAEFVGQAVSGLASTALGTIVGGAQYLGTMGQENGLETMAQIQEAGTYQPRTQQGKRMSELVAMPFEASREWGKEAGEKAFAKGASPESAAFSETWRAALPDIALSVLGIRSVRRANARTAAANKLAAEQAAKANELKLEPQEPSAPRAANFDEPTIIKEDGTIDYARTHYEQKPTAPQEQVPVGNEIPYEQVSVPKPTERASKAGALYEGVPLNQAKPDAKVSTPSVVDVAAREKATLNEALDTLPENRTPAQQQLVRDFNKSTRSPNAGKFGQGGAVDPLFWKKAKKGDRVKRNDGVMGTIEKVRTIVPRDDTAWRAKRSELSDRAKNIADQKVQEMSWQDRMITNVWMDTYRTAFDHLLNQNKSVLEALRKSTKNEVQNLPRIRWDDGTRTTVSESSPGALQEWYSGPKSLGERIGGGKQAGMVDPSVFVDIVDGIGKIAKGSKEAFKKAYLARFKNTQDPEAVYELWQDGKLPELAKYAKEAESIQIEEGTRILEARDARLGQDIPRPGGYAKETLGATEKTAALIDAIMSEVPKRVIPHTETIAAAEQSAREMGFGLSDIAKLRKQTEQMHVRVVQAGDFVRKHMDTLEDLARRAKETGSQEDMFIFGEALMELQAVQDVARSTSNIARALEATKILKSEGRVIDAAMNVYDSLGSTKKIQEAMDIVLTLKGPQRAAALRHKPSWMKGLVEWNTNMLMSATLTPARNVFGNVDQAVWLAAERYAQVGLSKIRRQGGSFSEANAYTYGLMKGLQNSVEATWLALRTDLPYLKQGKRTFEDPLTTVEMQAHKELVPELLPDRLQNTPFAKAFGWAGEGVRVPGRVQMAIDSGFKSLNYAAEISYQAKKIINAEIKEGKLKPEDAAARAVELEANPTEAMHNAAMANARRSTFTSPLGDFGRKLQTAKNHTPIVSLLIPFFRTPLNIQKETFKATPLPIMLTGEIGSKYRAMVRKGGEEGNRALAHMAMGSTIAAYMFMQALEGNIVGAPPTDPAAREWFYNTYKLPYSIQTENGPISVTSLGKSANLIMIAADMAKSWHKAKEGELEEAAGLFTAAMYNQLGEQTYLQSVGDFIDAMRGQREHALARFAGNYVNTLTTPRLVAQVSRAMDPTVRQDMGTHPLFLDENADPNEARLRAMVDKWKRDVPGYSEDLPAEYDYIGRPKERATAWLLPALTLPADKSPVMQEIGNLELQFAKIPEHVYIAEQKIDLDKYQRSQLSKFTGIHFNRLAEPLVTSTKWSKMPNGMRKAELTKLRKQARALGAATLLLSDKKIQHRVPATMIRNAQELLK